MHHEGLSVYCLSGPEVCIVRGLGYIPLVSDEWRVLLGGQNLYRLSKANGVCSEFCSAYSLVVDEEVCMHSHNTGRRAIVR